MLRCLLKKAWLALLVPLGANAFEAVDALVPSTTGRFAAYPAEPAPASRLWVQGGLMHDTNVLRRPGDTESERIGRLGLGGRVDQRVIGRQSVVLEGRVDGYRYDRFSQLDHTAYSALGEWHWEVGNDLSGVLGLSRSKYQASLAEVNAPLRDLITETRFVASGAWRVGPHLRLRAGGAQLEYDRPARDTAVVNTTSAYGAADYVTALGNAVGIEYHHARGDAPVVEPVRGSFVNNDFIQRDLTLVATWAASPQLRFAGAAGRSQRTYSELPGRDVSAPTYRAALDWFPTTKTILTFAASKQITSLITSTASHIEVRTLTFGPAWAITAKTNVSARFLRENLLYSGEPAAALGVLPPREDIIRGIRFGAYWELTRHLHFQFALDHGERESNRIIADPLDPTRAISLDYRYNAAMVNARYTFW